MDSKFTSPGSVNFYKNRSVIFPKKRVANLVLSKLPPQVVKPPLTEESAFFSKKLVNSV